MRTICLLAILVLSACTVRGGYVAPAPVYVDPGPVYVDPAPVVIGPSVGVGIGCCWVGGGRRDFHRNHR